MPSKCIAIFNDGRSRQRGAALLIILVILVVGIAAIMLTSLTSSSMKTARQAKTAAALAQAKDALIGYAVTYGDTHSGQVHGYLPCPDSDASNGEGSSNLTCGTQDVSVIGRLPWSTLDLSTLRDGDGECLWYAVSGTYKNNPKTGLMNWDTNGQFQAFAADGTQLTNPNEVVAVIFAPGASLGSPSQNRSPDGTAPICGGNYTASNYLDSGTVNSIAFNNASLATGQFIQGTSGGTINDQMVFITRQDIWNAVQKRTDFQPANPNNPLKLLTKQVALCLAYYGHYNYGYGTGGGWSAGYSNKALPWAAPLWLGTNALTDYYPNTNYHDSADLYAGRVPYNVATSRSTSNNLLGSNLMTSTGSCAGWPSSLDPWWNNWKDHLFYALGYKFKPTTTDHAQYCSSSICLTVSFNQYAALVFFAGPRLSALTQTRADKSDITQYLEGINASHFPGANGNETYTTGTASPTFNDVLCYINDNLQVTCP